MRLLREVRGGAKHMVQLALRVQAQMQGTMRSGASRAQAVGSWSIRHTQHCLQQAADMLPTAGSPWASSKGEEMSYIGDTSPAHSWQPTGQLKR